MDKYKTSICLIIGKLKNNINKLRSNKKFMQVLAIILCALTVLSIKEINKISAITDEYNQCTEEYNKVAKNYNEILQYTSMINVDGAPQELEYLEKENTNIISCVYEFLTFNSEKKIKNNIRVINEVVKSLEQYIIIANQITNPTEYWVEKRLKDVSSIDQYQIVNENNDPEGLYNQKGGYKGCIYFSLKNFNNSFVPGKSIVEKGTDGGGSIEIYENVSDAIERCNYLSQYDGTILYSGSYALVGTMVIRISYALSGNDQLILTNELTKCLTKIINIEQQVEKIEITHTTSALKQTSKIIQAENTVTYITDLLKELKYSEYDFSNHEPIVGRDSYSIYLYMNDGNIHDLHFNLYDVDLNCVLINGVKYRYDGDMKKISKLYKYSDSIFLKGIIDSLN